MYAEVFPSAQRFISSVDENVNVELRTISGATGPPRPCLGSPRCIASVASPHFADFFVLFIAESLVEIDAGQSRPIISEKANVYVSQVPEYEQTKQAKLAIRRVRLSGNERR